MAEWAMPLLSLGAGAGVAAVVRMWLIYKVTVWSLTADDAGRHALAILAILKPHLLAGRHSGPPVELRGTDVLGAPKDPPAVGPGGT
jgi:hypothetical protein